MGTANAATVAQSNRAKTNFQSMTFTWQAPSGSDGTVDFRYISYMEYMDLVMYTIFNLVKF